MRTALVTILLLATAGCADFSARPTFPVDAAQSPVVHEQALLGLDDEGNAAALELMDAEGEEPTLTLLLLDHAGGRTRTLLVAPKDVAARAALALRDSGQRTSPLLLALAQWPEGTAKAAGAGLFPRAPAPAEPGRRRWTVTGASGAGSLPLAVRIAETPQRPRAVVLALTERPGGTPGGDEAELARVALSGNTIRPEVWIQRDTVWLQVGSVNGGGRDPLRRSVTLRGASLGRGEAELHNLHGLEDYSAGDLDAARREFDRAIAADPSFVDSLYNAAAAAALADREADAVSLLQRAAAVDSRRVQVLGRNDADFRNLRRRADVRKLLGLSRLPPEGVPPPP